MIEVTPRSPLISDIRELWGVDKCEHLVCFCCRHLYDVLKQSNIDGMVHFCDASSISVGKPHEKSQVLATRLQQLSTNQILLVPYNSG